ncbi:dihydroorotase [Synechococcus sp. CS-1329]|jgi:dihydroorotase|uniref:dihydroorotase n=1 Tax=Synechococcus sp. CS-1329 TaxID=2847975 RepID=UPI00223AA05A|nr:dihydroorotase [Synechococcus sp. CS-1329]MCT0219727.1 dihydroorotase [Synechococcus sp. CS-1329]
MTAQLLKDVQLLQGPAQPLQRSDVLIEQGVITAIGTGAGAEATRRGLLPRPAGSWLLAPALVDPHSVLEEPEDGRAETLGSLVRSAAAAGYGTVALLPRARNWRDRPECLRLRAEPPFELPLWGGFSLGGRGDDLSAHADLLAAGALGLAEEGELPPLPLLERGLSIGECADRPVLLAPRNASLDHGGFVREGVEALRAGWPLDPPLSETIPLQNLLALAASLPEVRLRLANLSTAAGVQLLRAAETAPMATVCWWHLVADSGSLDPVAEGWRLVPSLGTPADRRALVEALADGVISAVAVHHQPLDPEEQLLPLDQRRPGLAGHRYVLPLLWQQLVREQGWSAAALWEALCWGPARLLALEPPALAVGSRRWILFDPDQEWTPRADGEASKAANQPLAGERLRGQVLATGLLPELWLGPH